MILRLHDTWLKEEKPPGFDIASPAISGRSSAERPNKSLREGKKFGDYFVTGNLKCDGEYPGFCVIAGVVTVLRFRQRLQAASRVSL
jgi:hypothetical protein